MIDVLPPYIYLNMRLIYVNNFSNCALLIHDNNTYIYPNECGVHNVYIRLTKHNC